MFLSCLNSRGKTRKCCWRSGLFEWGGINPANLPSPSEEKKNPNSCLPFSESLLWRSKQTLQEQQQSYFLSEPQVALALVGCLSLRNPAKAESWRGGNPLLPVQHPEELELCLALGLGNTLRKLRAHFIHQWLHPAFSSLFLIVHLSPKSLCGHFLPSVSLGGFGLRFFRVDCAKEIKKCPISQVQLFESVHHLTSHHSFHLFQCIIYPWTAGTAEELAFSSDPFSSRGLLTLMKDF